MYLLGWCQYIVVILMTSQIRTIHELFKANIEGS